MFLGYGCVSRGVVYENPVVCSRVTRLKQTRISLRASVERIVGGQGSKLARRAAVPGANSTSIPAVSRRQDHLIGTLPHCEPTRTVA